jgi:hypothetical protein
MSPAIIPRMEDAMSLTLGYRVKIEDILLSPNGKIEEDMRMACIRVFCFRSLSRNQKIL